MQKEARIDHLARLGGVAIGTQLGGKGTIAPISPAILTREPVMEGHKAARPVPDNPYRLHSDH